MSPSIRTWALPPQTWTSQTFPPSSGRLSIASGQGASAFVLHLLESLWQGGRSVPGVRGGVLELDGDPLDLGSLRAGDHPPQEGERSGGDAGLRSLDQGRHGPSSPPDRRRVRSRPATPARSRRTIFTRRRDDPATCPPDQDAPLLPWRRGPGRRRRRDGRPGGAARLATLGPRRDVAEQAHQVGGKLGTFARDGFAFDTGPSLLTLPAVYRDLFVKTGRPLEDVLDLTSGRPGGALPLPRRHLGRRAATRPRPARAGRRGLRRAGAGRTGPVPHDRAPDLAGHRAARSSSRRSTGRVTWLGWRAVPATCARSRRGDAARARRGSTCATRGCGCSSTATRPTPGRTRGGRRRRWPSCRTSSRPSAPGTCRAGCAGWRLRGARAGAAARCRRAHRHRGDRGAGRAAGSTASSWPTASGSPPTSWCPTPTRRTCTATW